MFAAHGVNPVGRDDVARERIADRLAAWRVDARRQRIVDRDQVAVAIAVVAEVADARRRSRHGVHRRDAAALLDAGVIGEEEGSIVSVVEAGNHHRAAERATELVPIERRHRVLRQRRRRAPLFCARKSCARRTRRCAGTRRRCRAASWCRTWWRPTPRRRRARTRRRTRPTTP